MQGRGQARFAGQFIESLTGFRGWLATSSSLFLQIGCQFRGHGHIAGGPGAHHQHLGLSRQAPRQDPGLPLLTGHPTPAPIDRQPRSGQPSPLLAWRIFRPRKQNLADGTPAPLAIMIATGFFSIFYRGGNSNPGDQTRDLASGAPSPRRYLPGSPKNNGRRGTQNEIGGRSSRGSRVGGHRCFSGLWAPLQRQTKQTSTSPQHRLSAAAGAPPGSGPAPTNRAPSTPAPPLQDSRPPEPKRRSLGLRPPGQYYPSGDFLIFQRGGSIWVGRLARGKL